MTAQYWTSVNVIRATADKEFPGAVVSSLADPWGQATAANSESGGLPSVDVNYRVIFERDFYETFTGFLADGDIATARQMTRYIFGKVELPDGSFPRDALINGAVASDNYVLEPDEQALPTASRRSSAIATWRTTVPGRGHLGDHRRHRHRGGHRLRAGDRHDKLRLRKASAITGRVRRPGCTHPRRRGSQESR
jgi:hypothetical protein